MALKIEGIEGAIKTLECLPDKFQAQVLRKIFKKAGQPIIDDAKSRLMGHSPAYKKLVNAIGFIPLRTSDPVVLIGVRAKGAYKDAGFMGHWVEYGVSGIKNKSSNKLTKEGDESFRFFVSRVKQGGRYRNDIPPQPYMRPAIDSKRGVVSDSMKLQFAQHLNQEVEAALRRYKGIGAITIRSGKGS